MSLCFNRKGNLDFIRNGYRFQKYKANAGIGTTYWRCQNRACQVRLKLDTERNVVYERGTHLHEPQNPGEPFKNDDGVASFSPQQEIKHEFELTQEDFVTSDPDTILAIIGPVQTAQPAASANSYTGLELPSTSQIPVASTTRLEVVSTGEDELFLQQVANSLSRITDRYKKELVKLEIHKLLFQYEFGSK